MSNVFSNSEIFLEKDRPIQSEDLGVDFLHRTPFADELARAIKNYVETNEDGDGLVIGGDGAGGTGKTSLLNLLRSKIKSDPITKKVRICEMNSWLVMDKNELAREFFRIINDANKGNWVFDAEKIRTYGKYFIKSVVAATSLNLDTRGLFFSPITFSGEKILEHFEREKTNDEQKPLINMKNEIKEKIQKKGNWIIFFIDDIDRLSGAEIAELFKLVKNVADFPYMIYILAYDKAVVSEALNGVQPGRGHDYIQKVVQLSYHIPDPDNESLAVYLTNKLETVDVARFNKFQPEYFRDVHYRDVINQIFPVGGASLYIHTIRDCNRVFNSFNMKYSLCGKDCDVADLLTITILELYAPHIAQIIYENQLLLCHKPQNVFNDKMKEGFVRFMDKLNNNPEYSPRVRYLLASIFPVVAKYLKGMHEECSYRVGTSDWHDNIYILDNFRQYFALRIPSFSASRDDVLTFLQEPEEYELYEILERWDKDRIILSALRKADIILRDSYSKNKKIANSFLIFEKERVLAFLRGLSKVKSFAFPSSKIRRVEMNMELPPVIIDFIEDLLSYGCVLSTGNVSVYRLADIHAIMLDSDVSLLIKYAVYIICIKLDSGNQYVHLPAAQFNDLERFFVGAIKLCLKSDSFWNCTDWIISISLNKWKSYDESEFKQWIMSMPKKFPLRFLKMLILKKGVSEGKGQYGLNPIAKDYFSLEALDGIMQNLPADFIEYNCQHDDLRNYVTAYWMVRKYSDPWIHDVNI